MGNALTPATARAARTALPSPVWRSARAALSLDECAYLRFVADGIDQVRAARQFLGVQHGAEALGAHKAVLDKVRALARRKGDSRWRLLGIAIPADDRPAGDVPSVESWAEAEGLDDWSFDELVAMHAERFPNAAVSVSERRRATRNARLRDARRALLAELEAHAAAPARPSDLIEGWLDPRHAAVLKDHGLLTLADLRGRILRGGRWWAVLPAFGPVKAGRLAAWLDQLIGRPMSMPSNAWSVARAVSVTAELCSRRGYNRAPDASCQLEASDDRAAVHEWIVAKSGSHPTSASYYREADRFLLWCGIIRDKVLSDVTAADCRAYADFVSNVPESWVSRRKVPRMSPGWAPFFGPLSLASQHQALTILHALFEWLIRAGYLAHNPWALLNRRVGDDPLLDDDPTSRAIPPKVWQALEGAVRAEEGASPASAARLRWLLAYGHSTGLRASELIRATRGDLRQTSKGWLHRVQGKGRRRRFVTVPSIAIRATRVYFEQRGLAFDDSDADTPLFASLVDPRAPVSYSALYQTIKRLFVRVAKGLPLEEAKVLRSASTHWLRHTFATRAAEGEVPPDIIQEQLGQADPRTTARYYRAQIARRAAAMERLFPADSP